MITAIVLAAGASQRMGATKALLPFRGTTFLGAILDAVLAVGLAKRVAVLGVDADKILSGIDLSGVEVLRNPDPRSGPIESLRLALRAPFNHPVEASLVWHVDRPHVSLTSVQALVDRFRRGGAAIVIPSYQGQRGHPVIFGREVFQELLDAPDGEGARAVVRADRSRIALVPVDDPAVIEDIDTPEAYQELLRREDAV